MTDHICPSCGKKAHDFTKEEPMECVPPYDVLVFGEHVFNQEYRKALFNQFPTYTTEEVVGSYLGYNPHFPSQRAWLEAQENNKLLNGRISECCGAPVDWDEDPEDPFCTNCLSECDYLEVEI